jgi:hypothetical protein
MIFQDKRSQRRLAAVLTSGLVAGAVSLRVGDAFA